MISHSLESLEAVFGIKQEDSVETKAGKKRLSVVPNGGIPHPSHTCTSLLGDNILIHDLNYMASKCSAIDAVLRKQINEGVEYRTFFLMISFFTQLGRSDLAHEFSRLNPKYSENYDQREDGYINTQKIIDQQKRFFESGGKRGYLTYRALGFENICNHSFFNEHSSPVKHFRVDLSISRFVKKSPVNGKRTFSSGAAVEEFNRHHDVIFKDDEASFYRFNGIVWERVSDNVVNNLVNQLLGEGGEPNHVRAVIEKIKCLNLIQASNFNCPNEAIPFKNGYIDISSYVSLEKKKNTDSAITPSELKFISYEDLPICEVKRLYLTGTLGANYDPNAKISEFKKYLDVTFDGNDELIKLVQEMVGYCLTYGYPFHVFFLLKGPGGNGKGVLLFVIAALVGEANISRVNFAKFNRFSTSELQNKLVNITDELPKEGSDWDLLKNLTGGGFTSAERKHKPCFSFKATAKHIVTANEYPSFSDPTQAFWERVKIIPFNKSFRGKEDEIHSYEKILVQEIDGIAYWALEGLIRLLNQRSFTKAVSALKSIEDARLETDSLRQFIEKRCLQDYRLSEYTEVLYRAYQAFCKADGVKALSHKNVANRLLDLGVKKEREPSDSKPRRNYYLGIGYDSRLGKNDIDQVKKHKDDDQSWTHERPRGGCANQRYIFDDPEKGCDRCWIKECTARGQSSFDTLRVVDANRRCDDHGII